MPNKLRTWCFWLNLAVAFPAALPLAHSQTKPTVVSTSPAAGATGVSRTVPSISVTFSKAMRAQYCGLTTSGWGAGNACAWSVDKKTLTYSRPTPPTPLAAGSVVTVYLNQPGSLVIFKDEDGIELDPYTFSFTVAGPVVVSTQPAARATVNSSIASVSVTFNVPMDTSACGATTDNWLGGVANCNWTADKKTMSFSRPNASSPQTPGVTVSVTLNPSGQTPTIKDTDGNALETFSFFFYVERSPTQFTKIPANPGKGFFWPYYLYVPSFVKSPPVLMVEPNVSGWVSDDPAFHDQRANDLIVFRASWADYMGVPYLVPTFPRPASDITMYTQALDRKTIQTTIPGLVRIDLQLIAMIQDAQSVLAGQGITVDKKMFMWGHSASGSFVSRFAVLHPDMIKAALISDPGWGPIVPVPQWNGTTLPYPDGTADLEQLVGKPFDLAAFQKVALQLTVGDVVSADPWWVTTDPEVARIIAAFGDTQVYERWPAYEAAYLSVGSTCRFSVFPYKIHISPPWEFSRDFFEANRVTSPTPVAKPQHYKIYFPHVASGNGWETEIALVNTVPGGEPVKGVLQAFAATGGTALESIPLTIPIGGRVEVTVGSAFTRPWAIAYLVYQSDSGFLAGYTRFQQPGNRASLKVGIPNYTGLFTKIETDGWTGVAFVNVDSFTATVDLAAIDDNGVVIATKRLTLVQGQKYVGMVSQLFGANASKATYVKYTSDKLLLGFTVSGSADGQMLDGLHSLNGEYISPEQ
jgi:pimeloyl-ACP methyl ester carboxylesterase/methionine-rich copper-binding protein CopC